MAGWLAQEADRVNGFVDKRKDEIELSLPGPRDIRSLSVVNLSRFFTVLLLALKFNGNISQVYKSFESLKLLSIIGRSNSVSLIPFLIQYSFFTFFPVLSVVRAAKHSPSSDLTKPLVVPPLNSS